MARVPAEQKARPGLDLLRSPLNVGPIKGDVTPDYNVPPAMPAKDPLGYLPKENNMGTKGKRGK